MAVEETSNQSECNGRVRLSEGRTWFDAVNVRVLECGIRVEEGRGKDDW